MNENDSKNTTGKSPKGHLTVLLPEDHPVVRALENVEFAWGSSQYDTAAEWYKVLCALEGEPGLMGRDKVISMHHIEVGKVQPFEGDVLVGFKEVLFVNLSEWEADGEDMTVLRTDLEDVRTVTEALYFLANWSWDLWSGVPYIARIVFPELNLDNVPDVPGSGPPLNVMVQGGNSHIGVMCWLLKSYGFVENDESFKGWDT